LPIRFCHRHESRMRMVAVRTRLDHRNRQVLGVFFIVWRAERGLRRDRLRRRRRGRALLCTAADHERACDACDACNARHNTNLPSGPFGSSVEARGGSPSRNRLGLLGLWAALRRAWRNSPSLKTADSKRRLRRDRPGRRSGVRAGELGEQQAQSWEFSGMSS
jgi:hypothetical protein